MIGNAMPAGQANEILSRPGDTDSATAAAGMYDTPNHLITGGMIRDLYNAATRTIRAECVDYWL
jgi:hypothetical protein